VAAWLRLRPKRSRAFAPPGSDSLGAAEPAAEPEADVLGAAEPAAVGAMAEGAKASCSDDELPYDAEDILRRARANNADRDEFLRSLAAPLPPGSDSLAAAGPHAPFEADVLGAAEPAAEGAMAEEPAW
jgi:hypothetical protein